MYKASPQTLTRSAAIKQDTQQVDTMLVSAIALALLRFCLPGHPDFAVLTDYTLSSDLKLLFFLQPETYSFIVRFLDPQL